MISQKHFSRSILAIAFSLLSVNGMMPVFAVSETMAIDAQTVPSEEQNEESQAKLIAQFGGFSLPDILDGDITEDIDNRVEQLENRVESKIKSYVPNVLLPLIPENLFSLEETRLLQFSDYFDRDLPTFEQQPSEISQTLETIAQTTGHRYALVYVSYQAEKGLEFLLFAPGATPQSLYTEELKKEELEELIMKFRSDLFTSLRRPDVQYLADSQSLYKTLITPIEGYLKENKVDGLIFSMDQGLRSLPLAALHDGDRYLIEKYSLALIPSFVDINSQYTSLKNSPVLAMGAETFQTLDPLPGAALEVDAIADLTTGQGFLNEQFTVANFLNLRDRQPFPIVHFATHAAFNSGSPEDSSIYLWNDQLNLNEINQLNLDNPPVELLVLSACQTALGSYEAELGFAGLTIASGSKSALGSLWSVSDAGTLILMQNFYNALQQESTKSEALRQAQLEMLRGNLQVVDGQVRNTSGSITNLRLTDDLQQDLNLSELVHPYYWSGFTLVGQPW